MKDDNLMLIFILPIAVALTCGALFCITLLIRDLTQNGCWPTCEKTVCKGPSYNKWCDTNK